MEKRKSTRKRKKTSKIVQKRNSNYRSVISFFEKNNKWPSATSKNEKEQSLGEWIVRISYLRRHKPERLPSKIIELVERINIDKSQKYDIQWENIYSKLKDFIEREKRWPSSKTTDQEESSLRNWCTTQRSVRRNNLTGSLNDERIKMLDSIGFKWSINRKKRTWDESFSLVKKFYKKTGKWPIHATDPEENRLAKWCSKMRAYKSGSDPSVKLTPAQIKKLTNAGFLWEIEHNSNGRTKEQLDKIWINKYKLFCEFIKNNKRYPKISSEKAEERSLYTWWMRMGRLRRKGLLKEDRISLLEDIGFRWGTGR